MVSLDDLSAELLLNIASCVGHYSLPARTRQQDLYNLSLTARKYRDISQEILHQWITIQPPRLMLSNRDGVILGPPGSPRIAQLARTLVQRPDLGQKARRIDLVLLWHPHNLCDANGICPGEYGRVSDDIVSSCKQFLNSERCSWASRQVLTRWCSRTRPGSYGQDSAFAGIILASTPALEALDLRSYIWDSDGQVKLHVEKGDQNNLPLELFCPSRDHLALDFVGEAMDGGISTVDLAAIPGFAKLKQLRVNGLPSWGLVTLPSLQSLHCVLHSGWLNFGFVGRSQDALLTNPSAVEPHITKLFIETMLTIIHPDPFDPVDRIHYLHENLLPKLPMLKHLSVRLVTRSGWKARHFYTVVGMEYSQLVSLISSLGLETLIIDTTEACEEDLSRKGLLRAIQPARSLTHLTKLRRLVAPQEFFFPVYSDRYPEFFTCDLPNSIESIEVLDSTVAVKKYAKHLCHIKSSLPNLNTFVGWRDREEHHLAPDNRLKPDVAPMMIDMSTAWEDHCRDWGRFWAVNNSVWSQLEGAGVKVQWKQNHARGWRDT